MGFIQGNARRLRGHRFMGQSALTRYNLLGLGKGLRKLHCRDYLNNGQRMYNLGVLAVFSLPSETPIILMSSFHTQYFPLILLFSKVIF